MTANTPGSKKAKGSNLEREIAQDLVDAGLDKYARRQLLSGGGFMKGDIYTHLNLHIESKCQENTKFVEWYNQALRDRPFGRKIPLVVWRRNYMKNKFVFIDWSDFLEIYAYALKGGLNE